MPLDEADLKYLWDMLDAAKAVRQVVAGVTRPQYLSDLVRKLAAERAIEIVGKAARHVSCPLEPYSPASLGVPSSPPAISSPTNTATWTTSRSGGSLPCISPNSSMR
jgi:hypothetical protein